MRDQQPANVYLRRLLPLIAVAALLGPGAARAAAPLPDSPPAEAALAPDPAPVTHNVRAPLAVTPGLIIAPSRAVVRPTHVVAPPAPPRKHHTAAPARHAAPAVPVVDVTPSLVDLHPSLGALPALPNDDSSLVLLAAALLAAAAAAGTGTILTLTARVRT